MAQQGQINIPEGTKCVIMVGLKNQQLVQVHSQLDRATLKSVFKDSFDGPEAIFELEGLSIVQQDGEIKLTTESVNFIWENIAWWQITPIPEKSLIAKVGMIPPPDAVKLVTH